MVTFLVTVAIVWMVALVFNDYARLSAELKYNDRLRTRNQPARLRWKWLRSEKALRQHAHREALKAERREEARLESLLPPP